MLGEVLTLGLVDDFLLGWRDGLLGFDNFCFTFHDLKHAFLVLLLVFFFGYGFLDRNVLDLLPAVKIRNEVVLSCVIKMVEDVFFLGIENVNGNLFEDVFF